MRGSTPQYEASDRSRFRCLLAIAALLYLCVFAATFLADPLGQSPVLDGRENLAWAAHIRDGSVPAEPIYRALLYPWLLAKIPVDALPFAATIGGLCLHGLNALLVGLIAARLWRQRNAAWLAALLFAVYPVALYFAGQVLDITLSITLFLGGLYALLSSADVTAANKRLLLGVVAGVLGGLAVTARPNLLPAVLCFPVILLLIKPRHWGVMLSAALGLLVVLIGQGAVNYKLSGQFRLLPWQGAYNLYAANREGANGKYYMQRIAFDEVAAGNNTTRMESERLYQQAVGADAPMSIDALNAHWRGQLLDEILADPARWFGLMGRKVLYTLNNWEQYNNLTYAFHKARWPVLKWNPLGWGILLMLATTGLIAGRQRASGSALYGIALLGLAYAAGMLLFFVSARFRLPLVPLLCVAAGGSVFISRKLSIRQWAGLSLVLIGLATLSFGNWWSAKDRVTFIQDELLLARASSEVGDDILALSLARAVLQRDPERVEALRLEVTSLFNLWLLTRAPETWNELQLALPKVKSSDAGVEFIRGVYFWRSQEAGPAIRIWQAAIEVYGPAATSSYDALQAVGQLPVDARRGPAVEQIRTILK